MNLQQFYCFYQQSRIHSHFNQIIGHVGVLGPNVFRHSWGPKESFSLQKCKSGFERNSCLLWQFFAKRWTTVEKDEWRSEKLPLNSHEIGFILIQHVHFHDIGTLDWKHQKMCQKPYNLIVQFQYHNLQMQNPDATKKGHERYFKNTFCKSITLIQIKCAHKMHYVN